MSDSESDDSISDVKSGVELGFLEKSASWKLESRFFPCKVGNKPAWLALSEDIPSYEDLLCSTCNKPLIFLCQLYAPVEGKDHCFHRMLYVFVCKADCMKSNCNTGFRVYRSQLPRVNKYYPFDPPVEKESWRTDICAESFGIKLCHVCGIRSKNHCGSCKMVYYCSKEHQVYDWKAGHKKICKEKGSDYDYSTSKTILFPEHEIITESEVSIIEETEDRKQILTAVDLPQCVDLQGDECDEDLEKMAFSEDDTNFMKFRQQIEHAPKQVIRYERNGTPLWITDNNVPMLDKSVQDCQYCGGKRIYEFQILPQLLNYLGLDVSQNSLDWGTLVIFTCEQCCDSERNYKQEYLIKQDMIANNE